MFKKVETIGFRKLEVHLYIQIKLLFLFYLYCNEKQQNVLMQTNTI